MNIDHDKIHKDRMDRERIFHDERFSQSDDEKRAHQKKYYSCIRNCFSTYDDILKKYSAGADVLEYGCGLGSKSADIASSAKSVTGIDLSQVAITKAIESSSTRGLQNISFLVMDAENMSFPDNQFDLVFGSGILHHLNLDRSLSELYRVLKPGGRVIFAEPLGLNPVFWLYRRFTPASRSSDEHPLLSADIDRFNYYFNNCDIRYFGLLSLLSLPFKGSRYFSFFLTLFSSIDGLILSIPFFQRLAWYSLLNGQKLNI